MKLNKSSKKISFIFIMLVISLTLFLVNKNIIVKAEENQNAKSIVNWVLTNNLPDGNYNVTVKGSIDGGKTEETITYPVELINYYDDVTYSATDGENGIVELGDDTDEYKMLIVKYHKNLTINEGVTLTANTHITTINSTNYELTYKKGMYIHVSGTLTNNGTISMTSRGTYNQKGENVYLWKNEDNTFEYVPAIGGAGADGKYLTRTAVGANYKYLGNAGTNGTKRQTGGGGSGGGHTWTADLLSYKGGNGSAGTSYSGGSGGGASNGYRGNCSVGSDASPNGGQGGNASKNTFDGYAITGGAGNPTGNTCTGAANTTETGTGGLLILTSPTSIEGTGKITSDGSYSSYTWSATGGGSGAGSINIFTTSISDTLTLSAQGMDDPSHSPEGRGGIGGNGTVTTKIVGFSNDNYLSSLSVNHGNLSPSFDSKVEDYTLLLDSYDVNFEITGTLSDKNASVTGLGKYEVELGQTKEIDIIVTSQIGEVRIYKINATRKNFENDSHNSKLSKLNINGYEEKINPEFHPLTKEYNINIYINEIDLNIETETFDSEATVKIEGNKYIKNDTGIITITVTEPHSEDTIYKINYTKKLVHKGIIGWVSENDLPDGSYNVTVKGKKTSGETEETITYPVELINYYDDVTYNVTDGENGIVELGDGTAEYKMLIVKYHKNLTINEGVTLTANTHTTTINDANYELTYKKGMYVYVGGTLTNNGTISMTSRGTYNQEGENVYLIDNEDGTYEYVPAVGGAGADGKYLTRTAVGANYKYLGNAGENGIGRQTGGGGSGGGHTWSANLLSYKGGNGSAGTSYSGGSGGGASNGYKEVYSVGSDASPNGGAGGNASRNTFNGYAITGGAGNPTGNTCTGAANTTVTGTGGLLILSSKRALSGTGKITSDGSYSSYTWSATGGGSGAGSINIFTSSVPDTLTLSAQGMDDTSNSPEGRGGIGGNGTVSIFNESNTFFSKNNYLNNLSSNYGELSPSFKPTIEEYTLTLDKYTNSFILSGIPDDATATVTGLGKYKIDYNETKTIKIIVTSGSGNVKTYTITVTREKFKENEHTSKLSKLEVENYEESITPEFNSLINEYNIEIMTNEIDLNIKTETFDSEAEVKIKGNKYIKNDSGTIIVTVTEPHSEDTIYKINYTKVELESEYDFEYTGGYQTFNPKLPGKYKIELWGASGGTGVYSSQPIPGKGAYAQGIVNLQKNKEIYIYVGGKGANSACATCTAQGGYNGGGLGNKSSDGDDSGGAGGGATDIRLLSSDDERKLKSLRSRIMVAAGGGGGHCTNTTNYTDAMNGGTLEISGLLPNWTTTWTPLVNQTRGGAFGYGLDGANTSHAGAGGGGGYYGGYNKGGGRASGGSSYISGYLGCVAITSEEDESPKEGCTDGTDDVTCSYHYSGKVFTNAIMKAGNEEMPTHDGTSTMTGNTGNGYAKIMPILLSKDNYLVELTSDYGQLSPMFDPNTEEYTLTLDKDISNFTVSGTLSNSSAKVSGLDSYSINEGETKIINILVTSESGEVKTYKISVTKSDIVHTSKLTNLKIEGYEKDLNPTFDRDTLEYNVDILSTEIDLNIMYQTIDENSTVKIEGNKYIKNNSGVITITVSNPYTEDTIYKIKYKKVVPESEYDFDYTGDEQEFDVPVTGVYKIETWGAQGGERNSNIGGYGGFSEGVIRLKKSQSLYVNIGGKGSEYEGGYNGGGSRENDSYGWICGSGGGATHIATKSGLLSTLENSKESILIVSGAGGGSGGGNGYAYNGGSGGGYKGVSLNYSNGGGTQISGGYNAKGADIDSSFGQGGKNTNSGAGGGGFYGGASGGHPSIGYNGSGGSGYIGNSLLTNKSMYCYECEESDEEETKTISTTNASEKPISKYAKKENGYAKITPLLTSNDNYLSSLKSSYGELSPSFDPVTEKYTLTLDKYTSTFTLTGILSDEEASVIGLGKYKIDYNETKNIDIVITSKSGDVRTYTVTATREKFGENEHTSKLSKLEIENYEESIEPEFNSLINEYNIEIMANEMNLNINAEAFDEAAEVTIIGNKYMTENTGLITITVTEPHSETTIYNINYTKVTPESEYDFDYTGDEQEFDVPVTGVYKIETWGAQGGSYDSIYYGGYGSYSTGKINLIKGTKLYINIGESGKIIKQKSSILIPGTYNGGGSGYGYLDKYVSSGGGATHIAIKSGLLKKLEKIKSSILIVSGGGGGTAYESSNFTAHGGSAGGITGNNGYVSDSSFQIGTGANQAIGGTGKYSNGSFGFGGSTISEVYGGSSGGGSGYYGGGSGYAMAGAGGGSGYIGNSILTDKSMYCYNCEESTEEDTKTVSTTNVSEKPISEYAKQGNGYAKITPLLLNKDNYLTDLKVSKEGNYYSLNPEFDQETEEYKVKVGPDDYKITVEATLSNELSKVEGLGEKEVTPGINEYNIIVTSENGDIRNYKLTVERDASSNTNIKNMTPSEGILSPEFNNSENEYTLEVEQDVTTVDIEVELESEKATITGNKNITLDVNKKDVEITVTAEDGSMRTITLNIIKKASIEDISIDENNIVIVEGESKKINIETVPAGIETKYIYETENNDVVKIDENGLVTGLKEGTANIVVYPEIDSTIKKNIVVQVLSKTINSETYKIVREEDKYIIGMEERTTISEFISNIENDSSTLKIYNKDLVEELDYTSVVKTGQIIKLIINGKEYDELLLIVRGDINGDGEVNVTDKTIIKNHILSKEEIIDYRKYAADVVEDNEINVSDNTKLGNYLLGKITTLN